MCENNYDYLVEPHVLHHHLPTHHHPQHHLVQQQQPQQLQQSTHLVPVGYEEDYYADTWTAAATSGGGVGGEYVPNNGDQCQLE